ncbi:MAG TPA: tRNA 2-thiouridine(34) synthase MnmA [Holosporales bacterium]|nr:tRNA 2-thiouridine(34) synthase MnmA [Holosporales bacterium]
MKRFQLDDINKGDLIAVAMSGGVDSSVAAALMVEAGYNVIGITLQLYDQGELAKRKGACCAGQDIYDAKIVADKLGFPHYVLDYESIFKQQVIEDFVDSYSRGETPIPCIQCNQKVKFKDLLKTAKDLGAKALVTGHYVKRLTGEKKSELHRAHDDSRDQSYFLFTTTQEQLDYLRFPLGGIPKSETRDHAKRFDLQIADKPDSQDICFVPNGNYVSVIEKLKPGALEPGDIVHVDGTILGRHDGTIKYTIGQRRGLGVSSKDPLYVVEINPELKQVIVGPKECLAVHDVYLKDVNLLEDAGLFKGGLSCAVKIRSTHAPVKATVFINANDEKHATVHFENPEYGVANGQACVFYNNNRVLGGGWITADMR